MANYLTSYKVHLRKHIRATYTFTDNRNLTEQERKGYVAELLNAAVPIPAETVDWLRTFFTYVHDKDQLLVYDNTRGLWSFHDTDMALRNLLTDYFTMVAEEAYAAHDWVYARYASAFFGVQKIPLLAQRLKSSISFLERRSYDIVQRTEHLRYFTTVDGRRALLDLTKPTYDLKVVTFAETQELRLMHLAPQPIALDDTPPALFLRLIHDYMLGDPDRIAYFEKVLAYLMAPYNYNQAYVTFVGDGRNGKGTVVKVLQDILGPHTIRMNAELLNANPATSFKKDDALAATEGRSLLIFNEIDERMVASTQNLKDLTEGGRDEYGNKIFTVVRPAYSKNFEVNICGIPLIIANNLLNFSDWSLIEPIFKRLILVPFEYKITVEDPTIMKRLADEYPQIQAWLYKNYFKHRGIAIKSVARPADIENMFIRYHRDSDILQLFWDECLEFTNNPNDLMLRGDIYRMYETYCKANGRKAIRNKGTNGFATLSEKFFTNLRTVNRGGNINVRGLKPTPYYLDDVSKSAR